MPLPDSLAALYRSRATPPALQWPTPGALARFLEPTTVQTPALDLIDSELVRLLGTPNGRLIISMPPQEGKSSRASRRFPTWALTQKPGTRITIASYSSSLARKLGRTVRDDIISHGARIGLHVRADLANQQEWELVGTGGGMYAAGVGSALTGRPVDMLIIDDPLKDRVQADSLVMRDRVWDWWTDVGSTRLAPGAPVVLILTRWHEDDLAGRLLQGEDAARWRVVNIPAQAETDTDPLGRVPGEFMQSARRRTLLEWEAIKVQAGARTWASLYQGRPTPDGGRIFPRTAWARYDRPLWTVESNGAHRVPGAVGLTASWDMAFKDSTTSDFVVGQVWLHRGPDAFLLDQTRDRLTFTATVDAVRAQRAKWPQITATLVEDKANGTAVLDTLRKTVPGLVAITPHESKEARAHAVSPFVEAGNVHLPAPEIYPWVAELIEEATAFPQGAHDDQIDAITQALQRIYLNASSADAWMSYLKTKLAKGAA